MSTASAATIAAALDSASAVTICCHVRPDADTIGSGLALGLALSRRGVDVEVSYPGSEALPASLAALPGSSLLRAPESLRGHPVVVAVDAANLSRLEDLATVFETAETSVTIDHHASNGGFGDLDLIDPAADCTAVLVLDVLDAMGCELDADVATCIYAGLTTDTGSFRWARPESFRIAARLLETGVDARTWSRVLFDSHPFEWFTMMSRVLASARLEPSAFGGEGLVYAVVDQRALAGMSWEESESVVDTIRTAREAEVAAVFKESAPGHWTVSLRSKDIVDLVPVARAHGGGGHRQASGYSDTGTADDVVARFLESI